MWTNKVRPYFLILCVILCACQNAATTTEPEPLIQSFVNDRFQIVVKKDSQLVELFYCMSLGSCDLQILRHEAYPIVQELDERLIFDMGNEKVGEITWYSDSMKLCNTLSDTFRCSKFKREDGLNMTNRFFNPLEKSFRGFLSENISLQEELLMNHRVEANLSGRSKEFIDYAERYKAIFVENELNIKLTPSICWYQIEDINKVVWLEYPGKSVGYVKSMIEGINVEFSNARVDRQSCHTPSYRYPFIDSMLNGSLKMKNYTVGEIIIYINSLMLDIYEANNTGI